MNSLILDQCYYGIKSDNQAGFIAWSEGVSESDRKVIQRMFAQDSLDFDFSSSITTYSLDSERKVVQCMFADADQGGRRWPFAHILIVANSADYATISLEISALLQNNYFAKKSDSIVAGQVRKTSFTGSSSSFPRMDCSVLPNRTWAYLLDALWSRKRSYVVLPMHLYDKRMALIETLLALLPARQRHNFTFCSTLGSVKDFVSRNDETGLVHQSLFNVVAKEKRGRVSTDNSLIVVNDDGDCQGHNVTSSAYSRWAADRWGRGEQPAELVSRRLGAVEAVLSFEGFEKAFVLLSELDRDLVSVETLYQFLKVYERKRVLPETVEKFTRKIIEERYKDFDSFSPEDLVTLEEVFYSIGLQQDFYEQIGVFASESGDHLLNYHRSRERTSTDELSLFIAETRLKEALSASAYTQEEFVYWLEIYLSKNIDQWLEGYHSRYLESSHASADYSFFLASREDLMLLIYNRAVCKIHCIERQNFWSKIFNSTVERDASVTDSLVFSVFQLAGAGKLSYVEIPKPYGEYLASSRKLLSSFFETIFRDNTWGRWITEFAKHRPLNEIGSLWIEFALSLDQPNRDLCIQTVELACSDNLESYPNANFELWSRLGLSDPAIWSLAIGEAKISDEKRLVWLRVCIDESWSKPFAETLKYRAINHLNEAASFNFFQDELLKKRKFGLRSMKATLRLTRSLKDLSDIQNDNVEALRKFAKDILSGLDPLLDRSNAHKSLLYSIIFILLAAYAIFYFLLRWSLGIF